MFEKSLTFKEVAETLTVAEILQEECSSEGSSSVEIHFQLIVSNLMKISFPREYFIICVMIGRNCLILCIFFQ